MTIYVGSTNPIKINAVLQAGNVWSDLKVEGIDVPSGVSNQPRTDEETRAGAINRAKAALKFGLERVPYIKTLNQAENVIRVLGVGLEGGVERKQNELWSTVWGCVYDPESGIFESNGARFKLPEEIAQPILAGEEMGEVTKRLMGGLDVKRRNGMIGMVTADFVTRTEEYTSIIKLALGLWNGKNWLLK